MAHNGTTRVLLVDDDPALRGTAARLLHSSGRFEVHQAEDGDEAIEFLTEDESIDVMVLDLNMSNCSGWEVLRVARDPDNGWPGLAVVVLTVDQSPGSVQYTTEIGSDMYLTKPYRFDELVDSISRVCDMRSTAGVS